MTPLNPSMPDHVRPIVADLLDAYGGRSYGPGAHCQAVPSRQSDPVDVCAACGQTLLTTPSDPARTLFCDPCLSSLEARRSFRSQTIAAPMPQGGLF